MVGTALGIGAWGLVTGVAMVKAGWTVALAVLMSVFWCSPAAPSWRPAADRQRRADLGGAGPPRCASTCAS
jgi:hypothetical protein